LATLQPTQKTKYTAYTTTESASTNVVGPMLQNLWFRNVCTIQGRNAPMATSIRALSARKYVADRATICLCRTGSCSLA